MPSNLDYEMETLMGVLHQIQVCRVYIYGCSVACAPIHRRTSVPHTTYASGSYKTHARVRQTAVGGKVEKKATEGGGKVDKFMDLKQTMIGACACVYYCLSGVIEFRFLDFD